MERIELRCGLSLSPGGTAPLLLGAPDGRTGVSSRLGSAQSAFDAEQVVESNADAEARCLERTFNGRLARPSSRLQVDQSRNLLMRLQLLVRKGGFEPPRSCERQPLKLVRLPVPPLPLGGCLLNFELQTSNFKLTNLLTIAI